MIFDVAKKMKSFSAIASLLVAALLTSCDDAVSLKYSTRADAQAETLFARGWLPDVIPASSCDISMKNDLDLNISRGEFRFAAADHDPFVGQLARRASEDKKELSAYSYKDWIFWIHEEKNFCQFYMRLIPDKHQESQQSVDDNSD